MINNKMIITNYKIKWIFLIIINKYNKNKL